MTNFPQNNWKPIFELAKEKRVFDNIVQHLQREYQAMKTIYPPKNEIFRAFELCDFHSLKVILLGQDPYHGAGEANGLCFSVNEGIKPPPSLKNIFRELKLEDDTFDINRSSDLSDWASQGVLLLNTSLTVEKNIANSHKSYGWNQFTRFILSYINEHKDFVVFLLLGNQAKSYTELIDQKKHGVVSSGHPSFADSHKQFFGYDVFKKTNAALSDKGLSPIAW